MQTKIYHHNIPRHYLPSHHPLTTQSPLHNHHHATITTQSPVIHHHAVTITQSSPLNNNHYAVIIQSSPYNNHNTITTTQSSLRSHNHAIITQIIFHKRHMTNKQHNNIKTQKSAKHQISNTLKLFKASNMSTYQTFLSHKKIF